MGRGAGCSAVPAFWAPSPPSLLVGQGTETDQGEVPDKTLPSPPRKTKFLPQMTALFFSSRHFGIPSPVSMRWVGKRRKDPWQVLCS